MYIPADLGRLYSKPQSPTQFQTMLNNNILPIQGIDPNRMFKLCDEDFSFEHLDGIFKPDLGIRISRTPLLSNDPNTYASLSKFIEQNLRKYHTSLGNVNQPTSTPLRRPPETVGVTNGKTEVLPVGCALNPLISDPFKNVHLIPGCVAKIVDWGDDGVDKPNSNKANKYDGVLFMGQGKNSSRVSNTPYDQLKCPKNNLNRSTSTFLAKVITADNMAKRLSSVKSILITGHGRLFNIFSLEDDFKDFDIEIPLLKINVTTSVITTISVMHYVTSTGERNLDILLGYSSGDILWVNPFKMKYSRWNKNGKFTNRAVVSLNWSKNGTYGIAGFADGEVMFFHRDFDDDENYNKSKLPVMKMEKYMKIFKSLNKSYPIATGKNQSNSTEGNPIAHYKLARKAITAIETLPRFHNLVLFASDDGYIRMFDTLTETITDIVPSYYGGFLCLSVTNDGKYLIAGGEDDFVTIYEFTFASIASGGLNSGGNLRLIARLQGSSSWVKAVGVDYFKTTSGLLYRIGSVGDDGAINFYEFQPRNLPKVQKTRQINNSSSSQQRPTLESKLSQLAISSTNNIDGVTNLATDGTTTTVIPTNSNSLSKRRILHKHKNEESISSLKSSTNQQQLTLMELMKSTSQLSLNSAGNSDSITNSNLNNGISGNKKAIDYNALKRQNLKESDVLILNNHKAIIHKSYGLKELPVLLPIGGKNVDLGKMSGLHFEDKYVWAFLSTGELIRWTRPT